MDESFQDPNAPYQKREIDHQFKELFTRLDKQDTALTRIEAQTTKTNGRVNKLEWWQNTVVWALGVLWSALIIVTPLIIKYIKSELTIDSKTQIDQSVKSAVKEALSAYNIEYDYNN